MDLYIKVSRNFGGKKHIEKAYTIKKYTTLHLNRNYLIHSINSSSKSSKITSKSTTLKTRDLIYKTTSLIKDFSAKLYCEFFNFIYSNM
jgi:hypothetical protein